MALNKNFYTIKLEAGKTYSTGDLGNGVTASTVHQVFCITGGDITFTSLGGSGTFTWTATSGQYIDIILGSCTIGAGAEFIGFKAPWSGNAGKQIF